MDKQELKDLVQQERDSAYQDISLDNCDNAEYNRGKVRAFEIVLK